MIKKIICFLFVLSFYVSAVEAASDSRLTGLSGTRRAREAEFTQARPSKRARTQQAEREQKEKAEFDLLVAQIRPVVQECHDAIAKLEGKGSPEHIVQTGMDRLDALHSTHPLIDTARMIILRQIGDESSAQGWRYVAGGKLQHYSSSTRDQIGALVNTPRYIFGLSPEDYKTIESMGQYDPTFYFRWATGRHAHETRTSFFDPYDDVFVINIQKAGQQKISYPPAISKLGYVLLQGWVPGLSQNATKGMALLTTAANVNDAEAQLHLAEALDGTFRGAPIVLNDQQAAIRYLQLFQNQTGIPGHRAIASKRLGQLLSMASTAQQHQVLPAVTAMAENKDSLSSYLAASFYNEAGQVKQALNLCDTVLQNPTDDSQAFKWAYDIASKLAETNAQAQYLLFGYYERLALNAKKMRDFKAEAKYKEVSWAFFLKLIQSGISGNIDAQVILLDHYQRARVLKEEIFWAQQILKIPGAPAFETNFAKGVLKFYNVS